MDQNNQSDAAPRGRVTSRNFHEQRNVHRTQRQAVAAKQSSTTCKYCGHKDQNLSRHERLWCKNILLSNDVTEERKR